MESSIFRAVRSRCRSTALIFSPRRARADHASAGEPPCFWRGGRGERSCGDGQGDATHNKLSLDEIIGAWIGRQVDTPDCGRRQRLPGVVAQEHHLPAGPSPVTVTSEPPTMKSTCTREVLHARRVEPCGCRRYAGGRARRRQPRPGQVAGGVSSRRVHEGEPPARRTARSCRPERASPSRAARVGRLVRADDVGSGARPDTVRRAPWAKVRFQIADDRAVEGQRPVGADRAVDAPVIGSREHLLGRQVGLERAASGMLQAAAVQWASGSRPMVRSVPGALEPHGVQAHLGEPSGAVEQFGMRCRHASRGSGSSRRRTRRRCRHSRAWSGSPKRRGPTRASGRGRSSSGPGRRAGAAAGRSGPACGPARRAPDPARPGGRGRRRADVDEDAAFASELVVAASSHEGTSARLAVAACRTRDRLTYGSKYQTST